MLEFHNISCDHLGSFSTQSAGSILRLSIIFLTTLLIITLNFGTILILHNKHYSIHLRGLPKTLMTSLSLTDLTMGVCVCPVSFLSLAKGCFPFRKLICQIEAILISSLFHSSSLLLISIAVDRYIFINYSLRYHSIMTKKVHYLMALCSWVYSFGVYLLLILPNSQFTFDHTGLYNCEPYYYRDRSIIIVAFTLFFIPSILVIFYCYITIFLVAHRQLRQIYCNSFSEHFVKFKYNQKIKEKKKLYSSLIILSAISIGFLISISPWTLVEFITSVWKVKFGDEIEFVTTWIAISNSFWNPIFYGLLNKQFRLSCQDFWFKCFRAMHFRYAPAN